MKFLDSILYALSLSAELATAFPDHANYGFDLFVREDEGVDRTLYARALVARDAAAIEMMERRAEGLWTCAAEAKKALGKPGAWARRPDGCGQNCLTPRGRPDDGVCVDEGCSHCGGWANNYHCVSY